MPHVLFVTGKLAEPALRRQVAELAPQAGFAYSVAVLPITVIALAPTGWIARHLAPQPGVDQILLPGLCPGELDVFADAWPGVEVCRGPKDLRELPEFFGRKLERPADYGAYDIAILAEINHAPRVPRDQLIAHA